MICWPAAKGMHVRAQVVRVPNEGKRDVRAGAEVLGQSHRDDAAATRERDDAEPTSTSPCAPVGEVSPRAAPTWR